jgi:L-fucose isomerase-like protein
MRHIMSRTPAVPSNDRVVGAGFAYLPVASALHDPGSVDRLLDRLVIDLDGAGGRRADAADVDSVLAIVALTGGTERYILDAAAARPRFEPVMVVAHPWHNSLAAALESVARLHQDGRPARIVYLDGTPSAREALAAAARDVAVARRLHGLRIGLVGAPSDWLVASSPTADAVRDAWGPEVVSVDIAEALRSYRRKAPDAGAALTSSVVDGAVAVDQPHDAITAAARVHPVLADLIRANRLDALTVRCFDLVGELRTSGCLALAELNDAGITAGCEGDLPSTIAMVWTRLLLDEVPWMANPVQVSVNERELLLAHCTVARSLTTRYRIRSHFESGIGAAIDGALEPGPVTLVRFGGRRLDRYRLVQGESIHRPARQGLCRTQLTVRLPATAVDDLLTAPLGNHVVVVRGHHHDRLSVWLRTMRPSLAPA